MQEEGAVCYEALLRRVGAEVFTRDGSSQLFNDTWCMEMGLRVGVESFCLSHFPFIISYSHKWPLLAFLSLFSMVSRHQLYNLV
jgi:hypothetical protein